LGWGYAAEMADNHADHTDLLIKDSNGPAEFSRGLRANTVE
jgi:hypothetical protein